MQMLLSDGWFSLDCFVFRRPPDRTAKKIIPAPLLDRKRPAILAKTELLQLYISGHRKVVHRRDDKVVWKSRTTKSSGLSSFSPLRSSIFT